MSDRKHHRRSLRRVGRFYRENIMKFRISRIPLIVALLHTATVIVFAIWIDNAMKAPFADGEQCTECGKWIPENVKIRPAVIGPGDYGTSGAVVWSEAQGHADRAASSRLNRGAHRPPSWPSKTQTTPPRLPWV